VLCPALPPLGICLRDWIVTHRADAFLILSFYFGIPRADAKPL
jgi:dolichyl-phosphate-mannose-protein mannosyltransferase